MGSRSIYATVVSLVLVGFCVAPSAQAAYPGEPGRIAFQGESGPARGVFTMNPDGSDVVAVTDVTQAVSNGSPAWSPDGLRIGFFRSSTLRIVIVNPDGTSPQTVPVTARSGPTWSPDGLKVAFDDGGDLPNIFSVNLDGTGLTMLTGNDEECFCLAGRHASWSPTGDEIAFEGRGMVDDLDGGEQPGNLGLHTVDAGGSVYRWMGGPRDEHGSTYVDWSTDGTKLAFSGPSPGDPYNNPHDIFVINRNGSGLTNLTNSPQEDIQPEWSPDGTKIAFTSFLGPPATPAQCSSSIGAQCNWEIHTMNADGSGVTRLTNNTTRDMKPSWQPVQRPYARPAGASPMRVPLVPAFEQCTASNRTHGPPLAFPSCAPPVPGSNNLTVGVGDGSPAFSRSIGFVRFRVLPGNPGPPDEGDVQIRFSLSNVMWANDLSDYTGILQPQVTVRLTDRDGFQRQTTQDFPFGFEVPCVATSSTIDGGLCDLTTTADAVLPGSVGEFNREIWATEPVRVYDGGPTGAGGGEQLFAVQGIFSP